MTHPSSLPEFFAGIRSAGFFKRLFSWKQIKRQAESAYADYLAETRESERTYRELATRFDALSNELNAAKERLASINAVRDSEERTYRETRDRLERASRELEIARGKIASIESVREEQSLAEAERRRDEKERYQSLEAEFAKINSELITAKGRIASLESLREEQISAEAARRQEEKERYLSLETVYGKTAEEFTHAKGKIASLESLREEQISAEAERRQEEKERYQTLEAESSKITEELTHAKGRIASLESIRDELISAETARKKEEAEKYLELKDKLEATSADLMTAKEELSAVESVREEQTAEYSRKIERINTLYDQLKGDREKLAEEQMNLIVRKQEELATSWQKHETDVAENIRNICRKHDFVWCEKNEYPHPGTPDNVILIGKKYTIFDAKSPKNPEELDNFPLYLKSQAEGMKKYCRYEDVRKEAFLIVPSSTLDVLTTYQYDLAEYVIYVITPESLVPILQVLRQIENYEFTDTMSPEDREKLSRFIGKLSHTTKRKIQIDTYFSRELIDALKGIDALPEDFAAEIGMYEQKAKLNPPMEKRVKMIEIKDVESDVSKLETELAVRTAVGN